jgi:hypothetical protein
MEFVAVNRGRLAPSCRDLRREAGVGLLEENREVEYQTRPWYAGGSVALRISRVVDEVEVVGKDHAQGFLDCR